MQRRKQSTVLVPGTVPGPGTGTVEVVQILNDLNRRKIEECAPLHKRCRSCSGNIREHPEIPLFSFGHRQ
jgi:hypothetical protein